MSRYPCRKDRIRKGGGGWWPRLVGKPIYLVIPVVEIVCEWFCFPKEKNSASSPNPGRFIQSGVFGLKRWQDTEEMMVEPQLSQCKKLSWFLRLVSSTLCKSWGQLSPGRRLRHLFAAPLSKLPRLSSTLPFWISAGVLGEEDGKQTQEAGSLSLYSEWGISNFL